MKQVLLSLCFLSSCFNILYSQNCRAIDTKNLDALYNPDCVTTTCASYNLHPLELWLGEHQQVAGAIRWNTDKDLNLVLEYNQWHDTLKQKLNELYDNIALGNYPDFTDPLPNITQNTGSTVTVLSDEDACAVYFSFLASSLYHEINNVFLWSVLDYSEESLDVLYDWNEYLSVSNYSATGNVNRFTVNLTSTPSPPAYLMINFVEAYSIVEDKAKYTYGKILDWARDSLIHYSGGSSQFYSHWQYYGPPPMSSLIDGTTRISDNRFSHYTAGCHGTVCFTKWIGFLLNIPVIDDYVGVGHRIAILPSAGHHFITHGDDPYSGSSRNPKIAGRHLLVDSVHFFNHFGMSEYSSALNVNVGRRPSEIAFNIIPEAYKGAYCPDFFNNGNTEEDNYLANNYAGLINKFPAILMDSLHFWDRLHLALRNDPDYNWCFSGNNETINYTAYAPNWEYLENGTVNPDSSIYKISRQQPMKGKSTTCLTTDDWVEMVVYNTVEECWIGIDTGTPDIDLSGMDHAIRTKDNMVEVFENGVLQATLQDTFGLSVNWLKITIKQNSIKYALNGFVRYSSPVIDPTNYFVYFGAEGADAEINNLYCSAESWVTCCADKTYVNYAPIPDNTYKAIDSVISSGMVAGSGNVLFEGGLQVCLDPGFEIQAGGVFEAKIKDCQ